MNFSGNDFRFQDVKVFAGDNFYPPADADYKNLIWETNWN